MHMKRIRVIGTFIHFLINIFIIISLRIIFRIFLFCYASIFGCFFFLGHYIVFVCFC